MEPEESYNDLLREFDALMNISNNPRNEDYEDGDKTAYDALAQLVGLKHLHGNVYISIENNIRFVRTRFGFQPAEVFNNAVLNRELNKLLSEAQERNEELEKLHELDIEREESDSQLIERLRNYIKKILNENEELKKVNKNILVEPKKIKIRNVIALKSTLEFVRSAYRYVAEEETSKENRVILRKLKFARGILKSIVDYAEQRYKNNK